MATVFMYPSCFRHSYVQLQMVRSQRYQLYISYNHNTASNAQFMGCSLLYCIRSWYQLLWKNCFYLLLKLLGSFGTECASACSHLYASSCDTQKDTLQIAALTLTQTFSSAHSAFVQIPLVCFYK